jgi:Ni/Co efflux regulator RcnB
MGGVTTQDTHRGNDTRHGNGQGWNGDGHDRSHQGGNGAGQGPHQAQGFVRGSTSARGGHFSYQGRNFNRVHGSAFRYPRGYSYRRWGLGQRLPRLFLSPLYFFTDYAAFGFGPPPFGDQWVRYGPDLLLVDVNSGEVVYVIYGAFY